ncbi:hypothetical protein STSO111631_02570 [Stackebrandtia soli]
MGAERLAREGVAPFNIKGTVNLSSCVVNGSGDVGGSGW